MPTKRHRGVTRSHKFNSKDHAGIAEGTALPQEHVPKFFGKNGFPDENPKKTKKNGAGKGNWGEVGDEVILDGFNFANARRRSNSSSLSTNPDSLKSKFEINEVEPVFEEDVHGPVPEHDEKTDTSSTGGSEVAKDM
ncbi:ATPase-stabilizing factor 15 kDa protein [Rhypophila decipiens]|uniref:ATPase-stabilizing factor 15 kDa protein n=1 Tax=Rhypophila decipiens TaxID=261697 RepID=A0AAN6Y8K0_9PEZI|nr:ATPase-stabilizing factor 15 kDa protein [Rhypophila decipiens]